MARTLLPSIRHDAALVAQADGLTPRAADFAALWMEALGERAGQMRCDARLVQAAQAHAEYLASRAGEALNASMHVGRGGSHSNERVRAAGYRLPYYYEDGRNNVESCARTSRGAARALAILLASPPHRAHLLGEESYSDRVVWGVGAAGDDWVVVACPPENEGL